MTHYIHQVPVRLRIKSPVLKKTRNQEGVKNLLSQMDGIENAEINPMTGSVVIYFNPGKTSAPIITNHFQRAGYFDSSKALTNDQYIQNAVTHAGKIVKRAMFGSCFDILFQGSALSYLGILI